MKVFTAFVFAVSVAVASFACAAEYCDDMGTPLWTLGHENPVYDGTWYATYNTTRSHSPEQSIRTSLHGGGYVGRDSDRAIASRTFELCGGTAESLSVWYNSFGVGSGSGPGGLDAACYVEVYV